MGYEAFASEYVTDDTRSPREEYVVVEEPMEIQIQGHSIAVLMRTPGNDEELVRGFLLSEGLVTSRHHILRIQTCSTVPFPEAEDNILQVSLHPESILWKGSERNFYTSSSCGICGKGSIEAVLQKSPPLHSTFTLSEEEIQGLPQKLRAQQHTFEKTGGSHGAALIGEDKHIVVVREDVGRHNAVDKVIGAADSRGLSVTTMGLFVSGRISFEIVQKASMVGISWIGGVSAPSSLAIQTARSAGITLVGFIRSGRHTLYATAAPGAVPSTREKE